jgi:hypothetical protein
MAIFRPRGTIRAWHRHPYGQAVLLRDHVYVPIPKSASTWCKQLWDQGQEVNLLARNLSHLPHVIILRDPIERWIAGFAQCQVGNDPDWDGHWERLGWDWVFRQVVFDNHTEPQVSFLSGLNLDRITWLRVDDDLERNMIQWMKDHIGIDHTGLDADRYRGIDQPAPVFRSGRRGRSQAELQTMAREALETIPGARQRIEDFYQEDLKLFNSVRFVSKE